MPGAFDPYRTWLGIPPGQRPPDHYRLLGLPLFEDRPEAIQRAADQRMADLHALQTGEHAQAARELLAEVAAARVCLLDSQKKAAYDRRLRQVLQIEPPGIPEPPPVRGKLAEQRTATYQPEFVEGKSGSRATAESAGLGQLGEYELLEKLGEGGMGAVYKARHTKLKRVVALKVLPKGRREDDRAIARFEREMEAVGRLDHPNIVRAHDAREVEGTRFLVMEYVDGLDLAKLVRRLGPLPVADACELIRQAALGLQSACEHDLVHRDVKPSNLMLTVRGEVKLLDLGLARFQSQQPSGEEMTREGQALGTLDYMAPEQISDTHTVDIRADIYALGCTLYKLLSGRAPFSGSKYENAFEKMQGHLKHPVPPMRRFRGNVPKGLLAVLNRMLAKDPADRFATPAEVADAVGPLATSSDLPGLLARALGTPPMVPASRALEGTAGSRSSGLTRFLERVKIKPPPPPPGTEQRRWARPAIVIGSAAAGVLLLAILIAWAVKSGGGQPGTATALVFDWPEDERKETTLRIGQKRFLFPASGPLTIPCEPGEYQIGAVREGFRPNERRVVVEAGRQERVSPFEWISAHSPRSHLVLQWPAEERADARLMIDGQVWDILYGQIETTPQQLKVPLPAGPHKVWIDRRKFQPFEEDFEIVEGEDRVVKVVWRIVEPERAPVPSEDSQQKIAREIDQAHGVAGADTAAEKLEVAGKLLELGKQSGEDPAKRFVLLLRASELATEAADADLVREVVDVMAAQFKVDASELTQAALGRIAKIEEAQQKVAAAAAAAAKAKEEAAQRADAERLRQADYAGALGDADALVAAWDFGGAEAALAKLTFEEPDFAARLAQRRQEVQRMAALKDRIIANIKDRDPPYKRSELRSPGHPGTVVKVDGTGITVELNLGGTEPVAWKKLNRNSNVVYKLLQLVVDPKSADDRLAAGLLNLSCDETALAKEHFKQARSLDVEIGPYLYPLAEASFGQAAKWSKDAQLLMQKREFAKARDLFSQADGELADIQQEYGQISWFTSNQNALGVARAASKAGIREADAETLYAQAAKFLDEGELFELRDLLEKLKADYASTGPVTDIQRKPSFVELKKAVAQLGKRIIVRQDGQGDFKGIQAAIDAAPLNSLIEIQDNGSYYEKIVIDQQKTGLILRGGKGCWPVIRSGGSLRVVSQLVMIHAPGTTVERLVIAHTDAGGDAICLSLAGSSRIRSVILGGVGTGFRVGPDCEIENCFCAWMHDSSIETPATVRNSVFFSSNLRLRGVRKAQVENVLTGRMYCEAPSKLRFCTIVDWLEFKTGGSGAVEDSILGSVIAERPGNSIDYCCVFGKYVDDAIEGKQCISDDPQFEDKKLLDFRLKTTSPCLGQASDGGDLGCRFTPEMREMRQRALEFRQRELIDFK